MPVGDNPEWPPLTLAHPLLRLLDAHGGCPRRFPQILAGLFTSGLLLHPLAVGRALLCLCRAGSASLPLAARLFCALDHRDAFACTTTIRAFLLHYGPDAALDFHRRCVAPCGVPPNRYSFPLLAKVCAAAGAAGDGRGAHGRSVKCGLDGDLFARNAFIHMYASFGDMASANALFNRGTGSDAVTWNAMMNGYVNNGMVQAAKELFDAMPCRDAVSWNVMIAGYAREGNMEAAEALFKEMPRSDAVTWNAMLVGYAGLGEYVPARALFETIPGGPTLVSWNTMLALCIRTGRFTECLELFDQMTAKAAPAVPNEATMVSVLSACGNLGRLDVGRRVHSYVHEHLQPDLLLSTALLTMYTKCGDMGAAREVFDGMGEKNVVSWNAMISGYGAQGNGQRAVEMIKEMERSKVQPNGATFVCALSACARAGMVAEGWWCFSRMLQVHGIVPGVEHYGCVVDLLSKAGLVDDAEEFMNKMKASTTLGSARSGKATVQTAQLLGAVLSGCATQAKWKIGEMVGKKLLELEPNDVGSYVLLSNIYAAQGRWADVEGVRELMKDRGVVKGAGTSLVALK